MRRKIIEDQPVQVTVKSVRLNYCRVLRLTKAVRKPFLRGGRVIIVYLIYKEENLLCHVPQIIRVIPGHI